MTTISFISLVIVFAIISQLLPLNLQIVKNWHSTNLTGRLILPMSLSGICYLLANFTNYYGDLVDFTAYGVLVTGSMASSMVLWFLSESIFQDDFELKSKQITTACILCIIGGVARTVVHMELFAGLAQENFINGVVSLLPYFIVSAYIFLTIRSPLRQWKDDLVEVRRNFRVLWGLLMGVSILIVSAVQLAIAFWPALDSEGLFLFHAAFLLVVIITLNFQFLQIHSPMLSPIINLQLSKSIEQKPPESKSLFILDEDDRNVLNSLHQLMEKQSVFKKSGLTIGELAKIMEIPEYKLRKLINNELGFRNFSQFLNQYRIGAAKALLGQETYRNEKVLSIALEVGFSSLAPFNKAFKEIEGITPSEYRKGLRHGISREGIIVGSLPKSSKSSSKVA